MNSSPTEVLLQIEQFVKKVHSSDFSGHDIAHIERVVGYAKFIQKKEGGDSFLIEAAAWLHDVEDDKLNFAHSQPLTDFLNSLLPPDFTTKIVEIISQVSFKGGYGKTPTSLEAKIVQDADRMDAIGAIGIARTFAYGAAKSLPFYVEGEEIENTFQSAEEYRASKRSTIAHFYDKLLKLKDLMHTQTARQLAEKRHKFLETFLQEFYSEWTEAYSELPSR